MKMIMCILQDSAKDKVVEALYDKGFQVTVLPSTGGYFRKGNTTLLIGTDNDRVEEAITIMKKNSKRPEDPEAKRATVFVLNVNRHEQI